MHFSRTPNAFDFLTLLQEDIDPEASVLKGGLADVNLCQSSQAVLGIAAHHGIIPPDLLRGPLQSNLARPRSSMMTTICSSSAWPMTALS